MSALHGPASRQDVPAGRVPGGRSGPQDGRAPALVPQGSGVVELRAGGRAKQSGSRVMGYRAPNGLPYPDRIHHDTFVSEPGMQKVIESNGTTIITTQRALYSSPGWNRSWEFGKTTEIFHSDPG